MKKNELISILQGIEEDCDILIWNGTVGDYNNIKGLVPSTLNRVSEEYRIQSYQLERCKDESNWKYKLSNEEIHRIRAVKREYEIMQYVTEEDVASGRYEEKRVLFIDIELRNKEYWDREGSISY